jgi:hypothetical protein
MLASLLRHRLRSIVHRSNRHRQNRLAACVAIAATAGGCSLDSLKLPPVQGSLGGDAVQRTVADQTPAEAYSRVARGALKCWFGTGGALKQTHVFHASVEPPSAGGAAEIAVQVRDSLQSSHGSLRAFRVSITKTATGALVETQNMRFPPEQGEAMKADVARWLLGKEDCSVLGAGGWGAAPAAPAAETKASGHKRSPGKAKGAAKTP